MKLLLYDTNPISHRVEVGRLEPQGLVWHDPGRGSPPDLGGFDAMAAHATDAKRFHDDIVAKAARSGIHLLLYSWDEQAAQELLAEAKSHNPSSPARSIVVQRLPRCLKEALNRGDARYLSWDRLSEVLDLLDALWLVGLSWEKEGRPVVLSPRANSKDENVDRLPEPRLEGRLEELSDGSGVLIVDRLQDLETHGGETIHDVLSRVYVGQGDPAINLSVLAVSSAERYIEGLARLRNSLLAWAQEES